MQAVGSQAASHLLKVRDNAKKLSKHKAEIFHIMVARGLFVTKRSRGDVCITMSFLCARVQAPDADDWKKSCRLVKCMCQTIKLVPRPGVGGVSIVKWHVDATHAVHKDCKGQTGAAMTLGEGTICNASTKQKLNARSSAESKLVGSDDAMPQLLWINYFLEAQGWSTQDTIVGQDNKSCMLLEKNGKASSSKRTEHVNIRHFFVADQIQNKELKVVHCPTNEMVADFFTKPLQGCKFKKFRNMIVNIPDDKEISKKKLKKQTHTSNDSSVGHRSVLETKMKKQKQGLIPAKGQ